MTLTLTLTRTRSLTRTPTLTLTLTLTLTPHPAPRPTCISGSWQDGSASSTTAASVIARHPARLRYLSCTQPLFALFAMAWTARSERRAPG